MKYQISNIVKKARKTATGTALSLLGVVTYTSVSYASAADTILKGVDKTEDQGANNASLGQGIDTVVSLLLFTIGIISVIAIIIGGLQYTTSNGDQGKITQAKNIILYAVIGLVVALVAAAIVNFVVNRF